MDQNNALLRNHLLVKFANTKQHIDCHREVQNKKIMQECVPKFYKLFELLFVLALLDMD